MLGTRARHKLVEITRTGPAPIAEDGLKRIGELYRIEAELRGLDPEARLAGGDALRRAGKLALAGASDQIIGGVFLHQSGQNLRAGFLLLRRQVGDLLAVDIEQRTAGGRMGGRDEKIEQIEALPPRAGRKGGQFIQNFSVELSFLSIHLNRNHPSLEAVVPEAERERLRWGRLPPNC